MIIDLPDSVLSLKKMVVTSSVSLSVTKFPYWYQKIYLIHLSLKNIDEDYKIQYKQIPRGQEATNFLHVFSRSDTYGVWVS